MTARIFIKLILAITGILAVAFTAVDLIATPRERASFLQSLERELTEKAHVLELVLPRPESDFPRLEAAAGGRVTWIGPDGRVLGDSEATPERMENHASRPEVAQALAGKVGSSQRASATVGKEFFYVAVPVSVPAPGSVLRIAVPSSAVDERARALRNPVLLATALAFVPAALLAAFFARSASRRLGNIIEYTRDLAHGNFSTRLESSRGELGLLATNLNETGERLRFMMARLETEQAELERVERVRKDFVINVSHELRTPLASIQGYTETLLDGAMQEPANAEKFLRIIHQNAERLTRLTADLLVLSRIELEQQTFQAARHPVQDLLVLNADTIRPLADRKRLTLRLEPPGEEIAVFADGEAVQQILTNLLENAVKYTPKGGTITVGARALENMIEVFVRDTGTGIPLEDQARLFERFYRVDKARSNELGGTGLGLSIVKHLAQTQGGDVRMESRPGHGSTFYFTLPRWRAES